MKSVSSDARAIGNHSESLLLAFMYRYQGSDLQTERLAKRECRCGSEGPIYNIAELLRHDRIGAPNEMAVNLSTPKVRKTRGEPEPANSGYGKTYIFAISEDLVIHIALDSERRTTGAVKHETLFHNADVLAAGEICIEDGIVVSLNDHSGSYGTDAELETNPDFAGSVLSAFDKHGVPVAPNLRAELESLTTP
jgi:hypothetical protein